MTRPDRQLWRMLSATAAVAVLLALSNMPTPFYVKWQAEIGFSASTITLLFSAYIVGLLVSLAVTGHLTSRLGSRPLLVTGLALGMLASVLFISAHQAAVLLLARLFSGFSVGTAITAGIATLSLLGGQDRRRLATLLASAAIAAGAGIGPLLAGAAISLTHKPELLAFGMELSLLASAALAAALLPTTEKLSKAGPLFPHIGPGGWKYVSLGIGVFGCALSTTAFVLSLGPSLLARLAGANSPLVAGGMASSMFMSGALVQVIAARLAVRATFVAAGVATTVAACGMLAAAISGSPAPLYVAAALAGCGYGLAQLAALTLIASVLPASEHGQANALTNIGAYVPCGLVPIVTGFVVDFAGLEAGTTVFGMGVSLASLATTLWVMKALPRLTS